MKVNISLCTLFLFCTSQAIFADMDLAAVERDLNQLVTMVRATQEDLIKKCSELDNHLIPQLRALKSTVSTNITNVIDQELHAVKVRAEKARANNRPEAEKCYNMVEPLAKTLNETIFKDVKDVEDDITNTIDKLMTQFNDSYESGDKYLTEIGQVYEICDMFISQKDMCIESTVYELQIEIVNYKHNSSLLITAIKKNIDDIFNDVKYEMQTLISEVKREIANMEKQLIICLNTVDW